MAEKGNGILKVLIEHPRDTTKYIRETEAEFNSMCLSDFAPYLDVLEFEYVKVIDLKTGTIDTKFGIMSAYDLSGGMKAILIALKYANEYTGYTVNISNCSPKYLAKAAELLKNLDIKVVILYDGAYLIKTPIECQGKIYKNGREMSCDLW